MPTSFPALCVQYGYRRILRVNLDQRMRADAKVIRTLRSGHVQHIFEIPWELLTASERTTVDSFFQSVRGRYLGDITFTDPWDSVSYTCRLDQDSLDLVESGLARWGATLRLIEVADFKALKSAVTTFPALSSGAVVQFPYTMGRDYRTVVEAQEDDSEKRFEDLAQAAGIQRWAVGGDVLTNAEATALLNAFEGNLAGWRIFTSFTEPQTGTLYTSARFLETEAVHDLVAFGVNRVRLTLVQQLT